ISTSGRSMRSCMWITSAVLGRSASTFLRGTEAPATAFSLSSGVTTAYPVIFLSILTAIAWVLVVRGAGVGEAGRAWPSPRPSPASGRGGKAWSSPARQERQERGPHPGPLPQAGEGDGGMGRVYLSDLVPVLRRSAAWARW